MTTPPLTATSPKILQQTLGKRFNPPPQVPQHPSRQVSSPFIPSRERPERREPHLVGLTSTNPSSWFTARFVVPREYGRK